MRKFVLATLAALVIGTAAFAQPAEARCWWNGYSRQCWHPHASGWRYHHPYWRHYGSGYGPHWHHAYWYR